MCCVDVGCVLRGSFARAPFRCRVFIGGGFRGHRQFVDYSAPRMLYPFTLCGDTTCRSYDRCCNRCRIFVLLPASLLIDIVARMLSQACREVHVAPHGKGDRCCVRLDNLGWTDFVLFCFCSTQSYLCSFRQVFSWSNKCANKPWRHALCCVQFSSICCASSSSGCGGKSSWSVIQECKQYIYGRHNLGYVNKCV